MEKQFDLDNRFAEFCEILHYDKINFDPIIFHELHTCFVSGAYVLLIMLQYELKEIKPKDRKKHIDDITRQILQYMVELPLIRMEILHARKTKENEKSVQS